MKNVPVRRTGAYREKKSTGIVAKTIFVCLPLAGE